MPATATANDLALSNVSQGDSPVLRIRNLNRPPHVLDVSLDVFAGECLGIAGLVGSGRTELLRCIFGADSAIGGYLQIGHLDDHVRFDHPQQAAVAGMAMVTEDRLSDGLLLSQSVRCNSTLSALNLLSTGLRKWSWTNIIRRTKESAAARQMADRMQIQCQNVEQLVGQLSGGNQQKVILARWLMCNPSVLLLDEPTRGIDVASRKRIYQTLDELRNAGKALIMVSSDIEELLQTCDRIAVMSGGMMTQIFTRDLFDADHIMQACFSNLLTTVSDHAIEI